MDKYLYGASIQGIQNFIFQTNKLREIVGASDLVDYLSSGFFRDFFEKNKILFKEDNLILSAAGNIKYEFENREDCERIVRGFAKAIMLAAPGITVSQAVVKFEKFNDYGNALQTLENLIKAQRNKARYILGDYNPFKIGETARRTGGLGFAYRKDEVIDLSQNKKISRSEKAESKLMEILTGKRSGSIIRDNSELSVEWGKFTSNKNWIAIIHADGNGLGAQIMSIYRNGGPQIKEIIREFSKVLDVATKSAVKKAYTEIFGDEEKESAYEPPIRPILIGGDDITVIIKGDAAIPFTHSFLKWFEVETKTVLTSLESNLNIGYLNLGLSEGLTACAGVSFIKPNYPFHYGVHFSESLTSEAKKHSKSLQRDGKIPSSAFFLKIQSSYVEDYSSVMSQVLDNKTIRFDHGPYFLEEQSNYSTLDQLMSWIKTVNRPSAPKSGLRQWLGVIPYDPGQAKFMFDRIKQNLKERGNDRIITELNLDNESLNYRNGRDFTHLYDVINLSSL